MITVDAVCRLNDQAHQRQWIEWNCHLVERLVI